MPQARARAPRPLPQPPASGRVLLISGYARNEETQNILDLGVQGFLAKPFDLDALSGALRKILSSAEYLGE